MQTKDAAEVRIIRLLRAEGGQAVSGSAISASLGISRAAVWKHIERLRLMGYDIDAQPRKGYSLDPDHSRPFNNVEIAASLKTSLVGRAVYYYPALASTNATAFELGRANAPDGTVVIADSQTGGKGRLGRRWESPPGVNLYTSIILRPPVAPVLAHHLTFVAAVSVAGAVAAFIGRRPAVKWPNDVLIDSRKVAGILLEMDSEPDRVNFVVIGIGVNANLKAKAMPSAIRDIATSLSMITGHGVDRAALACALYSELEKWYKIYLDGGLAPVLEAWRGWFASEGKQVRVAAFGRTIDGVCAGVDVDGALLVRTQAGKVERVVSGDVETV
ncbi:MAG: biotin--[acetyl-CoA-carboxylase] ligase [Deltaproteobacteria bacterium]|nr:biotin--[acetyl-CoA-carboxylase] ligase [Deltaproteobacteria bacterium]